jgi:histidinol-phosphate aminotransferase
LRAAPQPRHSARIVRTSYARHAPGERILKGTALVGAPTSRKFDLDQLARPAVQKMHAYVPASGAGQTGNVIRLDMNESPYPPSEHVRKALADFAGTNRYPSFDAIEVSQAIADYAGVPVEQIIPGAGLDDVLTTLFMAFLDPGDNIIISEPTFGVYQMLASALGAETIDVPLNADFQLDADGVLAAINDRTKIVVICTPNNPTGNNLDPAAIEKIVANAPCIVAIDEAYMEFAGVTYLPLQQKYPNVAILRTMSKFAGMAGMRVGYGIFTPEFVSIVGRVAPAFRNVSVASTVAVKAALEDIATLRANTERIKSDRDALAANLRELPGVEPLPSETNFILVKVPVERGGAIVKELARRGIMIRSFPHAVLREYIRISIGTTEDHEVLLRELADILENGIPA